MNTSRVPVKAIVVALAVIGVIAFIIYGLYLANKPVVAPLQGQIDGRYIDISPKIVGRIAKLHVRDGDAAKQQLVDTGIRKEEIRTARANWERAVSAANLAEVTFKRINTLYKEGLVSQQRNDEVDTAYRSALDAVTAARAQYDLTLNGFRKEERAAAAEVTRGAGAGVLEVASLAADISLKSPISAEVDKVVLHEGELAPPGFPIISLVNLDDVWVVFNLREHELAQIRIGSKITGTLPALGGRTVVFSVYYISPKGEYATWRATRQSSGYDIKTCEVRARPVQKVAGLRPGMSVLVDRS